MTPTLHRHSGRHRALIGAILLALFTGFGQHALTRPAHAQTAFHEREKGEKPSQGEVDRALTDLLLCEWMTKKGSSLGPNRFFQVLGHLEEKNPAKGSGELVGEFRVLGHNFQRIVTAGGQGGGGALGWSATSSTDAIVRTLKERGYTFEPMTKPMVGFSGKLTRGPVEYNVWIGDGYHPFGPQKSTEGVTMMCGARETDAAKYQKMLEEQRAQQIYDTVKRKERQPQEWAEAILKEGKRRELSSLASYAWLSSDQIERLAQSDDRDIRDDLIANADAPLSTAQIERLLELRHHESVLRYRYDALTEAQLNGLLENTQTRSMARLAGGGAAALEELERVLRAGDETETVFAFKRLRAITPKVIDLVLEAGNRTAIVHLIQTYAPPYTPEQIDRILASDDPDHHIWLVRNRDFRLTRAQYERGVMHPNEKVSFWYRVRDDHTPSPQMIEEALTSPDRHTRYLWLMQSRIRLTPAQVARALEEPDESTRRAAYARKEVMLTPVQLDACLREPDYLTREVCVKRPELTLTQERFENIVGHSNRNLFRGYLDARKGQNIDLAPYVRQAMLTASDETLLRMAKLKELTITADDVRTVRDTRGRQVQAAYCRRVPEACP